MSAATKILLVDDDDGLRASLAEQLADQFLTRQAATGQAALDAVADERFDLILLDNGLPDLMGRDVARALRAKNIRTPIIMLTAASGESETVAGLEAGANDYIAKPFRMAELIARIRAQLRQHEASQDASFAIGPYTFQPGAKLLLEEARKRKIRLTDKETGILRYLCRVGGGPVTRETLLGEVWGYNAGVNTHTLETHIYRLRQKIEADPTDARILVTAPGGYRLVR